jgi:hypothetical protein
MPGAICVAPPEDVQVMFETWLHPEPAETVMVTEIISVETLIMFWLGQTAVPVIPYNTNPHSLLSLCL